MAAPRASAARCDHRTVRARVGGSGEPPVWDGPSSRAAAAACDLDRCRPVSILRRFVGGDRTGPPAPSRDARPPMTGEPPSQPVEAELAESLDTRPRHRRPAGRLARSRGAGPDDRRRDEAGTPRRRDHHPAAARGSPRARRLGRAVRRRRPRDADPRPRRRSHRRGHPGAARDGLAGHPGRPPRRRRALPGGPRLHAATSSPRSSTATASSAPCRRSRAASRPWTSGEVAFMGTLATHAAIALTNAELLEQTVARAAQLEVLQAASARMSRATTIEEIGATDRRRDRPDHRLPQRPGLRRRAARRRRPDRVQGRVGAYEQVDMERSRVQARRGFTGWVAQHGEPILVNDANRDPRGATIAGTDDVDESMLVVPMRYDGVDHRRHHAVEARARRVRRRRPAGPDDPRRPGRDRRRVRPAADPHAGPRRARCVACST